MNWRAWVKSSPEESTWFLLGPITGWSSSERAKQVCKMYLSERATAAFCVTDASDENQVYHESYPPHKARLRWSWVSKDSSKRIMLKSPGSPRGVLVDGRDTEEMSR